MKEFKYLCLSVCHLTPRGGLAASLEKRGCEGAKGGKRGRRSDRSRESKAIT
jgi:hypothetical protein